MSEQTAISQQRPRIVPVVEAPGRPESWPWLVGNFVPYEFFELRMTPSSAEIGSLFASLCHHIEPASNDTLATILPQMMELERFSLHGGLGVLHNGELQITPGCCCGFEDWRELLTIPEGESPWMGHDPSPWCVSSETGVRFACDVDVDVDDHTEIAHDQVRADLQQFHLRLRKLLTSLRTWVVMQGVTDVDGFIQRFDISFSISNAS